MALPAEGGHQISQCPILIAELLGDFLEQTSFDKEGAQRFLATMAFAAGIAKEKLAGIVHDHDSKMSLIFRWREGKS